jgi:hypothetical protein
MATLKKFLGDAGAAFDQSNGGFDRLYDVLKALAESVGAQSVSAQQAVVATATLGGMVVDTATKLKALAIAVGTTGTADSTTVQVHVNGVSKGELSVANTEADGTYKTLALDLALAIGDLVELVVSAAPTGGADLTATARMAPEDVTVE